MIGSPNYFRAIYDGNGDGLRHPRAPGSDALEALFEEFYADRGLASQPTAFDGRSDYGPFIAVGIPAGGLFTGAEDVKTEEQAAIYGGTAGEAFDPCYHQACDTFDNIDTRRARRQRRRRRPGDAHVLEEHEEPRCRRRPAAAQAQARAAASAVPNLVGVDQSVATSAS